MIDPEQLVERIREALHAWRDSWVEPHALEDYDEDDIAEVLAVLEEVEDIVEKTPAVAAVAAGAPDVEQRAFEDQLWAEAEASRVTKEVDRRPGPDTLVQLLALTAASDIYASEGWVTWVSGFLTVHSAIDFPAAPREAWRARIRGALMRDMIVANGQVPDGPFTGEVRYKLTERGRLELAAFERDRGRVVRYP